MKISPQFAPSFTYTAVSVMFTVVLISVSVSDACFIRNCPKGGKRSLESTMGPKRECMKCGPRGMMGQCVGPKICCSPHFGCYFYTVETEVCQQENQFDTPCFVTGDVCGANEAGRCVADGLCCDSDNGKTEKDVSPTTSDKGDSCADNDKCRQISDIIPDQQSRPSNSEILLLIQKLLRNRSLE